MVRRVRFLAFILGLLPLLLAQAVHSQPSEKKKVSNQSDLPRFTYPVSQPASELVQADAASFNAFARKVEADLDTIFRNFEIEDKAAIRRLLSARLDIQELTGQNQSALETLASLHAAQVLGGKKLGHERRRKAYIVNYADDGAPRGRGEENVM